MAGLGACGGDAPTNQVPADRRQPIVFVHGFGGSSADWSSVVDRFERDGWTRGELIASTYGSIASNADIAAAIRERVDSVLAATGAAKVDIVSFSMGGLSARYYVKFLGGLENVDAWVSVSGPNHGTQTAGQCPFTPCTEMRTGSGFLLELNSGDETPGAVRYATWWSPCDELVVPPESTILDGADNTETACLPHAGMFTETNYLRVRAFIAP